MNTEALYQRSLHFLAIFEDLEVPELQAGYVSSCLISDRDIQDYQVSIDANYIIVLAERANRTEENRQSEEN